MQSTLALTLSHRAGLRANLWTDFLLGVSGNLLVAVLAQVAIPLPFTPVPITGQTFAVLVVGAVLGSWRGAASLSLYVMEGALGLPVFAGGTSGLARLFGPTGGYLLGFIAAAYVVGWLAERGYDRRWWPALLSLLVGEAVIYLFGIPWLAFFVGADKVLWAGLVLFLPGDAIKLLLAAVVLPSAWALVRMRQISEER